MTSCPRIDHPDLVVTPRATGVRRPVACEVRLDRCEHPCGSTWWDAVADLEAHDDMRVTGCDGHCIPLDLSVRRLGQAFVHEGEAEDAGAATAA